MRARVRETRVFDGKLVIQRVGEVSARPRYTFKQEIHVDSVPSPSFEWTHPIPELFTWDGSEEREHSGDFYARTTFSRPVLDVDEIVIEGRQWVKRGHVWREMKINGDTFTQELWYKEEWRGHELRKDMWAEWNRSAREEIHILEHDGLRITYFFRRAKKDVGEPPGFFWYREAQVSLSPAGRLWRLALLPERTYEPERGVDQDFGYKRWPSDFWIKYWYDGKHLWTIRERIEGKRVEREIVVEPRRLKLL